MQERNTKYSRRRALLTVISAVLAAIGLSTSTDAGTASKRTIVTTRHTMALPGVTLPPGSYAFELVNSASSADVVLVSSVTGQSRVQFLGLTRRVERPSTLPRNQVLSFGEALRGEPIPIAAWYPTDFSSGHQFIY